MHETLNHADLPALLGRTDPTILEVGSNDGVDTIKMLEQLPDARIYCFEPVQSARLRWRKNLEGWRGASLHEQALGNREGWVDFYPSYGDGKLMPADWDYSGSIRQPHNHLKHHPWCGFGMPVRVPITKLDLWSADLDIPPIDFIWADVQGAEEDLIRGGLKTLARTRYFYTEFSDHEMYRGQITLAGILALLPDWEVARLYTEDVLLRRVR